MKATPLKLQRILQRLFAQQAREVASKLNLEQGTLPDMTHWTDVVAEAVKPLLLSMWQQGMVKAGAAIGQSKGASKSLQGALQESTGMATRGLWQAGSLPYSALVNKSRTRMVLVVKAKKSKPAITVDFDLFDPKVLDAVDAAAYAFCRDTMATATGDMRTALDRLRELMRTGLARGDAVQLLAREVRNIFADPARAFRIATTETSRAMHAGSRMAGVESGVVSSWSWLCSSDACEEICQPLDGKTVKQGEPYVILSGKPPYNVVWHPPAHPHCFCTETENVD